MKAIDTNVVIRLIVNDDELQFALAKRVLDQGQIFVSFGVLMECAWVLRSQYGFKRNEVNIALSDFSNLDEVNVTNREGLEWALERHSEGADFADMLHLLDAAEADSFVTFDKNMARDAGEDSPMIIEIIEA